MSENSAQARVGRVEFTGGRFELFLIVIRGYALMLPTIGLYRFWQATWKRRFYWQNTIIDGEPLEYTGTATQLLLGFFFALAFFLPIYIALFVLSMQESGLVVAGYAAIGAIIWFLMGYAIYRARDFRLSRTLWRGIRFDMRGGNAWAYALRRFLWSALMLVTLGLVYPWMASNLWKYLWRSTWYGDRKFEIAGNWRAFAPYYYGAYLLNLVAIGATLGWILSTGDFYFPFGNSIPVPGPLAALACLGCVLVLALSYAWYRTRSASRMLSTVSLGEAKLTVRVGAGALFGQFVAYVLGVIALLLLLLLTLAIVVASVYAIAAQSNGKAVIVTMFQSGTANVVLLILAYLIVLGAFGLLAELILRFGWWRLLARSSTISNPDSLRTVRATAEDASLIGQGLADALNVGAY